MFIYKCIYSQNKFLYTIRDFVNVYFSETKSPGQNPIPTNYRRSTLTTPIQDLGSSKTIILKL